LELRRRRRFPHLKNLPKTLWTSQGRRAVLKYNLVFIIIIIIIIFFKI